MYLIQSRKEANVTLVRTKKQTVMLSLSGQSYLLMYFTETVQIFLCRLCRFKELNPSTGPEVEDVKYYVDI